MCSSSSEDEEYNKNDIDKYEKAFAKSDRTDAILLVDEEKLHVNKALLSYHSDFFKSLFNSEFKEKSMEEIEIKDVKYEDFATLLSLIQDNPLEINWQNAENLLKLADRFLLRGSKMHVERFIISSGLRRHRKLILADQYNLENLLEHAIGLYNNRTAFQDFHYYNMPISDTLKLKMFNDFFKKFEKMGWIYIDGEPYSSEVVDKLEKAFAKSDKTDAILVAQGRKLHVNKALLSYHSDYFKSLFNSEFKEKSMKEIEIKDVKYVHFALLLSLVHDTPFGVKFYHAENLLKLADRFLLRGPKLHVENFIIDNQNISRLEKLVLADKYNLENLLEHTIELYNNKAAFQDFFSSSKKGFSDKLKVKMFDKFFDKYGKSL